jgi:hypothetical protein
MKCECGKGCEALTSKAKPSASEWYCATCHRSYQMDTEDIMRHGLDPNA